MIRATPHAGGDTMRRHTVLLADDHAMLLEAFKNLLESSYHVVGTVTDGQALVKAAEELKPDVILVDVAMPHLNGLDACERIRQRVPRAKVIFLTMDEDRAGYLVEKGPTPHIFTNPVNKLTEDYVSGRFG